MSEVRSELCSLEADTLIMIINVTKIINNNLLLINLSYIVSFTLIVKLNLEGYNLKNLRYLQHGDTRQDETEDAIRFQAWKACLGMRVRRNAS